MTQLATLRTILCLITLAGSTAVADSDSMPARKSLSGVWRFQLDLKNHGEDERWYAKTLPE